MSFGNFYWAQIYGPVKKNKTKLEKLNTERLEQDSQPCFAHQLICDLRTQLLAVDLDKTERLAKKPQNDATSATLFVQDYKVRGQPAGAPCCHPDHMDEYSGNLPVVSVTVLQFAQWNADSLKDRRMKMQKN